VAFHYCPDCGDPLGPDACTTCKHCEGCCDCDDAGGFDADELGLDPEDEL
jgi:hypothetical protein